MLRAGVIRGLRLTPTSRPATTLTNPLFRSISSFRRPNIQLQLHRPSTLALVQKRWTASSVSGKPASTDIPHAIQNAREEARGIAADAAKIIAAANFNKRTDHSWDGFSDITSGMAAEVPKPILITGLAGALPYVGTAASTLYCARAAGLLAAGHAARVDYDTAMNLLEAAAHIQVTYGAVLLSFLGALHWGMEFSAYGGPQGYKRLALGVAPVAFAWSTLALEPTMALTAQWVGFTAMWYADMRATSAGWTPVWYSQYRFYLSILIGTCIIFTLWGETFFNPVIETTTFSSSVANTTLPASSNTPEHIENGGKFAGTSDKLGEIETVEGDSYYVILKHKEKPEETDSAASEGEESEGAGEEGEESAKEHVENSEESQAQKNDDQYKGRGGQIKAKDKGEK